MGNFFVGVLNQTMADFFYEGIINKVLKMKLNCTIARSDRRVFYFIVSFAFQKENFCFRELKKGGYHLV